MRDAQQAPGEQKEPAAHGSATAADIAPARKAPPKKRRDDEELAPGITHAIALHERAHLPRGSDARVDALRGAFGGAADDARLHVGPRAARVAEEHGARALTHGQDVYFAHGAYRPDTLHGRSLIAHELAHVAQQSADTTATPSATHEAHANRAAIAAVQGRTAAPQPRAGLSFQRCGGFDASNQEHVERARQLAALFQERRRLRESHAPAEQIQAVQHRIDDEIAALRRSGISESEVEIEAAVRSYEPASGQTTTARTAQTQAPTVAPSLVTDLGRVEWRREDGRMLVIYGANGVGFARSDGLLLRAVVQHPAPPADPALAGAGQRGRTPLLPVAPEAMLGLPGQRRSASSLVTIGSEGGQRLGMVVDTGGAATSADRPGVACVPLDNIVALQGRMNIGEVRAIALTHLHGDHVANIVEFIAHYRIPPSQVFVADAWLRHQVLEQLRATADARLTAIGYGPTAQLGTVITTAGGASTRFAISPTLAVDVLFAPGSMRAHETAIANEQQARARLAAGTGTQAQVDRAAAETSRTSDAASLVYVVRNPLARTGVMYLQDMRGGTVTEIRTAMESAHAGSFAAALRGVTVLNGLGHHFGLASGREAVDVGGMRTLLRTLMEVNHQLTIVVQADSRSFASGTRSSPLLRFAQTIGARVVLVLEGTSDVIIDSNMQVQVRGPDVLDTAGETTARNALERLAQLEQARMTLEARGEFGRQELGLTGTAAEALAAVQAEIARLTALHGELTARAALTFHEETTGRAASATAQQRILSEGTAPGSTPTAPRPLAQIQADLAASGGPQFSEEVRARLQALVRTRGAFGLESTLGGTPRPVADALRTLPPLVRDQINARYERIRQAVLAEGVYADEPLRALETEVRALKRQLETAREALDPAAREPLTMQIGQLDAALGRIAQDRALLGTHREITAARDEIGRTGEATSGATVRLVDALSRHAELVSRELSMLGEDAPPARRAWLQEELNRTNAAINEALGVRGSSSRTSRVAGTGAVVTTRVVPLPRLTARTADVTGRALGGLMIYHSIQGLDRAITAFQLDEASLAQTTARVAHAGGSIYLGTRMLRGYQVGVGSFAILSAIDVVGTALGNYQTDEEWQRAFWTAVTRNSVQLAFLAMSQRVTAALVPRLGPLGIAVGVAFTLVVDPFLDWIGAYDFIERTTGFLPANVIDVQIELRRRINGYRNAIGSLQIARRSEEELTRMGARDPAALRTRAQADVARHRADAENRRAAILVEFDEAYREARVAHAGLQELDQLRQYFQELVEQATPTATAAEQTRTHFTALDRTLGMRDMSDADIEGMSQWTRIRSDLSGLESELGSAAGNVDWDDVREHQEKLQQMFSNARYRLDPASIGGGLRTQSLLPAGRARTRYQQLLTELEERWFRANRLAMRRMRDEQQTVVATYPAGATRPAPSDPEFARANDATTTVPAGGEYASQLRFLEDATAEYERLLQVQPPLPSGLTAARLYSDFLVAGGEYRRFVAGNSRFRNGLERLRSAEAILVEQRARVRQAGQNLSSDQRITQQTAIARSQSVVDARRVQYGYLYNQEAETLLGGGRVSEDQLALDLGRSGAAPLSQHEMFALQSGVLGDVHLSATGRAVDLRPELLPWARANRDRIRRLEGRHGQTDLFILSFGGHNFTREDNVLVGLTGVTEETTSGQYGHTYNDQVIALNDRARALLGSAPIMVVRNILVTVNEEDIVGPPP